MTSSLTPPSARHGRDHRDRFQRVRHARYYENHVVYHIIIRTQQGLWLLHPDGDGELRSIAAGILGRAKETFPNVRNHATVLLSNHGHMLISGDIEQLAAYVAFIKRELSRRWGPRVDWRGLFAPGYHATAIITPSAQRRCLKYVLSQSVKEGAVDHPYDWPGLHCAHSLVTGEPIEGQWFDGTRFGRALQTWKRQLDRWKARRIPEAPPPLDRADFVTHYQVTFDPLPPMEDEAAEDQRREVAALVDALVDEACTNRNGAPTLGVARVLACNPWQRTDLPRPPWFEERRRLIVWDDARDADVRAYLGRYWTFQMEFRDASNRWLEGKLDTPFPPAAFRPGFPTPLPQPAILAVA